ncbi:hypothetical protein G7054_g911 [Neopestalotiopsis clavispora]|nr:hypothetical protein G7054_g911 [Neopestalotiopsis clavispora]
MLPPLLPPEQILQVALLARKYEMSKALLFAQAHWLNASQRPSFVEAGYLLAAAAAFGAGDTFKNRSTNLIADYTEPFSELKNHNAICQVLPPTIFSRCATKHDITMNEFTRQLDLLRLNACIDIADVNSNWAEDAGDEIIDLANDSDWGSEGGIMER